MTLDGYFVQVFRVDVKLLLRTGLFEKILIENGVFHGGFSVESPRRS